MSETDSTDRDAHQLDLAREQTRLARERTILSHIRTGFASFLFGTAIFGFFGHVVTNLLGGFFVAVGVVFLATGWRSYIQSNRRTRELLEEVERPLHSHGR